MLDFFSFFVYEREFYTSSIVFYLNLMLFSVPVALFAWGLGKFLSRANSKGETVTAEQHSKSQDVNFWMSVLVAMLGGLLGYLSGSVERSPLGIAILPIMAFLTSASFIYLNVNEKPLKGLPVYVFAFFTTMVLTMIAAADSRLKYTKKSEDEKRIFEVCNSVYSNLDALADMELRKWVVANYGPTCQKATGVNLSVESIEE